MQWFLSGDNFAARGTFGNVWTHIWLSQLEQGVLLASRGQDVAERRVVHRMASSDRGSSDPKRQQCWA